MNPNNAIIGDSTGVELPVSQVEDDQLVEEKKMARYSKTAEFKRIQEYCEERIEFFQRYMPSGVAITDIPKAERDAYWVAANVIINEFKLLTNIYENAAEAVKDAQ